jgi:cysteine protease ATG4
MDPSMLLGFLIRDERDWMDWKERIAEVKGKGIVRVYDKAPPGDGEVKEREGAVDEVETFDDTEDEDTPTEVGPEDV